MGENRSFVVVLLRVIGLVLAYAYMHRESGDGHERWREVISYYVGIGASWEVRGPLGAMEARVPLDQGTPSRPLFLG